MRERQQLEDSINGINHLTQTLNDSIELIAMGEDGSNGFGEALSPQANQAIQSGGGGLY